MSPPSDGLSSLLFKWVPFRGIVGKLSLIAIAFPAVTVTPAAFTAHFMEVFWANFGLALLAILTIAIYGHLHEHTATLEGPDLVKQHQQEAKMQVLNNQFRGAGEISTQSNEHVVVRDNHG